MSRRRSVAATVLFLGAAGLAVPSRNEVYAAVAPRMEPAAWVQLWTGPKLTPGPILFGRNDAPGGGPQYLHGLGFDRDGNRVHAAGKRWDIATGKVVVDESQATARPHFDRLRFPTAGGSVAASSNGVWIEDPETGQLKPLITGSFQRVDVSADGTRALAVVTQTPGQSEVRVYALPEGTVVGTFAPESDQSWHLAANGSHVAAVRTEAGKSVVRVIEVKSGKEIGRRGGGPLVAWSPKSEVLAVGVTPRELALWTPGTDTAVPLLHRHAELSAVTFVPAGDRLVTAGGKNGYGRHDTAELRVWDLAAAPREVHAADAGHGQIVDIVVSPDGETLATAGYEMRQVEGSGGGCGSPVREPGIVEDLFGNGGNGNGADANPIRVGAGIVFGGLVGLWAVAVVLVARRYWGRGAARG